MLVAAVLMTACPYIKPGEDPVLVNSERSMAVATDSIDALFKVDFQYGTAIDAKVPGWKGAVNELRVRAPGILNAANAAVKAYRAGLTLYRADPTQITQTQLNALANDLGQKIVAAVEAGQQAAKVAATVPGGVK
jgi:hypothetical protein